MKFFCWFEIGELMYEHGHMVLHLATYHYHMNATELIWNQMEGCCTSMVKMGVVTVTKM
jgi:hypothetical protein